MITAHPQAASDCNPSSVAPSEVQPLDLPYTSSNTLMELKIKRLQRRRLTGTVIFVLDARIEVPAAEYSLIERYKLGNHVIYDSSSRKQHVDAMKGHLEYTKVHAGYRTSLASQLWGIGKTFYRFARAGVSATRASLSLRITVHSLMRGVHVECESLNELVGAEQAIKQAAENLRSYMIVANTFDGREEIHEF
jgi:hypothetical protein